MITVEISGHVNASVNATFAAFTDHEALSDIPGLRCTLVAEGAPTRNGVGALRRIGGGGVFALERITAFEVPFRYCYVVEGGLPLRHDGGEVRFRETNAGTDVVWTTRVGVALGPLAGPVERLVVGPIVRASLRQLFASAARRAERAS